MLRKGENQEITGMGMYQPPSWLPYIDKRTFETDFQW